MCLCAHARVKCIDLFYTKFPWLKLEIECPFFVLFFFFETKNMRWRIKLHTIICWSHVQTLIRKRKKIYTVNIQQNEVYYCVEVEVYSSLKQAFFVSPRENEFSAGSCVEIHLFSLLSRWLLLWCWYCFCGGGSCHWCGLHFRFFFVHSISFPSISFFFQFTNNNMDYF